MGKKSFWEPLYSLSGNGLVNNPKQPLETVFTLQPKPRVSCVSRGNS